MKRIISLTLVVLTLIVCFSSCGNTVYDHFGIEYEDTDLLRSATLVENVYGTPVSCSDSIAYFKQVGGAFDTFLFKHTVYNIDTNKILFQYIITTNEAMIASIDVTLYSLNDAEFFVVGYNDAVGNVIKTELYTTYERNPIATVEGKTGDHKIYSDDIFTFNNVAYRVDDMELEDVFEISPLIKIPNSYKFNGEYAYVKDSKSVSIYDEYFNFVYGYTVPEAATDVSNYILPNGDVLFQFYVRVPDDYEDYDYYKNNEKYNIYHYVVDPDDQDYDDIDLDFIVGKEEKLTDDALVVKSIDVLEDGFVEKTRYMIAFDEDMDIIFAADDMVSNAKTVTALSEDYLAIVDIYNNLFVVDSDGDIENQLSNVSFTNNNSYYGIAGGKIYDLTYELIFDYDKEGYAFEGNTSELLIFSKLTDTGSKNFYKFADDEMKQIAASSNGLNVIEINEKYYCVLDTSTMVAKYTYYNAEGTKLIDLFNQLQSFNFTEEGNCIATVSTEIGELCYRLSIEAPKK